MQCLYALSDIISTGLREVHVCFHCILKRAKRSRADLEICISTVVLMCMSVYVFVSEHGCVYVCV